MTLKKGCDFEKFTVTNNRNENGGTVGFVKCNFDIGRIRTGCSSRDWSLKESRFENVYFHVDCRGEKLLINNSVFFDCMFQYYATIEADSSTFIETEFSGYRDNSVHEFNKCIHPC